MMNIDFTLINWFAVVVCFVVGQVFLTLWFSVLFGAPWAQAYSPGKSKTEHTKEIPGATLGIGAVCTFILVTGIAVLQVALAIKTLHAALGVAAFISLTFVLATTIPGYAFLKRWNALVLAVGSQISFIFIASTILVLWQ